jgi:hypothetical protein
MNSVITDTSAICHGHLAAVEHLVSILHFLLPLFDELYRRQEAKSKGDNLINLVLMI